MRDTNDSVSLINNYHLGILKRIFGTSFGLEGTVPTWKGLQSQKLWLDNKFHETKFLKV